MRNPRNDDSAYLNYASTGLLPRETVRAVNRVLCYQAQKGSLPKEVYEPVLHEVRTLCASLIHADPEEIALTTNTTQGLQIPALLMRWQPRDELIITRHSFPANYFVWLLLRNFVRLRIVDAPYLPGLEDAILKIVTPRTRAIAVDWVHFWTGYRIDLPRLSRFCREHKIHLFVDAIQGVGALTLNVRETPVSLAAVGGAKWLISPWATGFAYISRDLCDELNPEGTGWLSYDWQTFERLSDGVPLRRGAGRLEGGTFNYPGFYGMRESLRRILATPESERHSRVLAHSEWLKKRLASLGYVIVSDFPAPNTSGILSFRPRKRSASRLFAHLQGARIACALREGHIRISPHYFTPASHLKTLVRALRRF
ncbi:MAG: aminotransferase class V-fold PLP-dependent enzyme [bacterium JZ-2024 1]